MRLIARLTTLLLVVSGMTVALAVISGPATAKDANCTDFNNQAAAQRYFLNHGGPNRDPDGLDADGDGVACETNPCPCYYGTGGGGGTPDTSHPRRKHVIRVHGSEIRNSNRFVVVGRILTYRGKFQVQRKLKHQPFKVYKRPLAKNPDGRVRANIDGPSGSCFKVVVPGTKKYKKTTKSIGCIVSS